jgi:hypothetical protein
MDGIDNPLWCAGCGVEITCEPFAVRKYVYCCQDCAQGIPCRCGERMEIEDERRSSTLTTISAAVLYTD